MSFDGIGLRIENIQLSAIVLNYRFARKGPRWFIEDAIGLGLGILCTSIASSRLAKKKGNPSAFDVQDGFHRIHMIKNPVEIVRQGEPEQGGFSANMAQRPWRVEPSSKTASRGP